VWSLKRLAAASTIAAIGLCACGSATATSTPTPTAIAGIDHYITTQVNQQTFSGTVLLAKNGRVLLDKAYGWSDEGQQAPTRLTTRFAIGSLTKQFTAMAILLLEDRGQLHVANPVCQYISGCGAAWRAISIQNLLTHTSGIPDYLTALSVKPRAPTETLLHYLQRQPLDFPPGSQFRYSNSGYAVLGSVIEDVAGESYADFLQHEIFAPLRLADTGYLDALPPTPPVPDLATGYTLAWTRATPSPGSPLFAAGSLYSTAMDLYRWDAALISQKLASPASIAQMLTPQIRYCDPNGTICSALECASDPASCTAYGYGWFLQDEAFGTKLVRVFWHAGLVPGFAAYNAYYPDQKVTLIILSNLDSAAAVEPFMAGTIVAPVLRQAIAP
jgi:CubicO group peptidase (beta-lactamase class C family)